MEAILRARYFFTSRSPLVSSQFFQTIAATGTQVKPPTPCISLNPPDFSPSYTLATLVLQDCHTPVLTYRYCPIQNGCPNWQAGRPIPSVSVSVERGAPSGVPDVRSSR